MSKFQRLIGSQREYADCNVFSNSPRYAYSPLSSETSVRLIRLLPGTTDAPIQAEIIVSAIGDGTQFEALSYTWGDTRPTARIHLDGTHLPLAANLESALTRLRYTNISRIIWIDALCIDQQNMQERQSQVLLMGQIYRASSSVMIWLGEESRVGDSVFTLMQLLSEAATRPDFAPGSPFFLEQVKSSNISLDNRADWKALDSLFWSAWFTRVWIIQELVLAKKAIVYFDSQCITWDEFHRAANCASSIKMGGLDDIYPDRVLALWRLFEQLRASSTLDLLSLLRSTRFSLATDAHDKIYGLLGIADATSLVPDYASPVLSLFIDVAKLFLEQSGYNFLSAVVDSKSTQVTGLPTWIPDWSWAPKALDLWEHMGRRAPAASGETEPVFEISESNFLIVSGAIVDSIAHMAPILYVWRRPKYHDSLKSRLQETLLDDVGLGCRLMAWERLALKLLSYPDGTKVSEAYHRTLFQDQGIYNAEEDPATVLEYLYSVFRQRHIRPFEEAVGYKEPDQYKLENKNSSTLYAAQYEQQLWDVCTHRRLVTTKRGYLGLVPASTRHGDKVAVFLGGSTPYILRKAGKGTYMFRGDCYVHGIMHGEALQKDHEVEELVLR